MYHTRTSYQIQPPATMTERWYCYCELPWGETIERRRPELYSISGKLRQRLISPPCGGDKVRVDVLPKSYPWFPEYGKVSLKDNILITRASRFDWSCVCGVSRMHLDTTEVIQMNLKSRRGRHPCAFEIISTWVITSANWVNRQAPLNLSKECRIKRHTLVVF